PFVFFRRYRRIACSQPPMIGFKNEEPAGGGAAPSVSSAVFSLDRPGLAGRRGQADPQLIHPLPQALVLRAQAHHPFVGRQRLGVLPQSVKAIRQVLLDLGGRRVQLGSVLKVGQRVAVFLLRVKLRSRRRVLLGFLRVRGRRRGLG